MEALTYDAAYVRETPPPKQPKIRWAAIFGTWNGLRLVRRKISHDVHGEGLYLKRHPTDGENPYHYVPLCIVW